MDADKRKQLWLAFIKKWKRHFSAHLPGLSRNAEKHYGGALSDFLRSRDHGLLHMADVYVRSIEILERFPSDEREHISVWRIELISLFHDAGRFVVPIKTARNYAKRKRKAEILHEYAGALLAQAFGFKDPVVREGILRHDFFSAEFDLRTKAPQAIEAQIVRLADKTSISPAGEIMRYDEYRKTFNFPLYHPQTSFAFRKKWNFSYARDPRTDQLCYFFLVLALRPEDFIHPVLQEYYREWSLLKREAKDKIIAIVHEERGEKQAQDVSRLIDQYQAARASNKRFTDSSLTL